MFSSVLCPNQNPVKCSGISTEAGSRGAGGSHSVSTADPS